MSTRIQAIRPYRKHGLWMYDDDLHNLKGEAFVFGMSEMIDDHLSSRGISRKKAKRGFRLLFSDRAFPGSDSASLVEPAFGGGWYQHDKTKREGWICPAVLFYFEGLPPSVHFNAEEITCTTGTRAK